MRSRPRPGCPRTRVAPVSGNYRRIPRAPAKTGQYTAQNTKPGENNPPRLFYCCGDAGKIKDLMTTGTEPEDGIKVPMSMKSKSFRAMPSMEITGFRIFSSS